MGGETSMLKRRRGRVNGDDEMELTPLIDCVFLLLIFFMVTTVFKEPYTQRVILPEAEESTVIEKKELVASINREGEIELNRRPATIETIGGMLIREKEGVRSVTLIIRTDKQTQHGVVLDMIEVAKKIGIEKVVLATEKKLRE
jgi:biopolymer transport protein ExbD